MGSDSLGKLFDIAAAIAVMMIAPILWAASVQDDLILKHMRICTTRFIEDVCHHGGLSQERYKAYLNEISAGRGPLYIEMESVATAYEPLYRGGQFTGEVCEYETYAGTDEILDELAKKGFCGFEEDSLFRMKVGRRDGCFELSGLVNGKSAKEQSTVEK